MIYQGNLVITWCE